MSERDTYIYTCTWITSVALKEQRPTTLRHTLKSQCCSIRSLIFPHLLPLCPPFLFPSLLSSSPPLSLSFSFLHTLANSHLLLLAEGCRFPPLWHHQRAFQSSGRTPSAKDSHMCNILLGEQTHNNNNGNNVNYSNNSNNNNNNKQSSQRCFRMVLALALFCTRHKPDTHLFHFFLFLPAETSSSSSSS